MDGKNVLFHKEENEENEIFRPWVWVDQSKLTVNPMMGLFAARNFTFNEMIGIYIGQIIHSSSQEDSIYMVSFKGGKFVDVVVDDSDRLQFGMGMHYLNDLHFQEFIFEENNENNCQINEDLSVSALRDIKKGEELTAYYRLWVLLLL